MHEMPCVMVRACNPSAMEAEVELPPTQGQPEIHSDTLSQKKEKKKVKQTKKKMKKKRKRKAWDSDSFLPQSQGLTALGLWKMSLLYLNTVMQHKNII